MAGLIDEVKLRIPAQRLVQLTNPDDPSATTVNDTILGQACTDTESDFRIFVGVDYDNTNIGHVTHATDGVVIMLMKRAERWNRATMEMEEDWHGKLNTLRLTIGGNTRLSPRTDSEMVASTDKRGVATSIVRPDFDSTKFDTLRPNPPWGAETPPNNDN